MFNDWQDINQMSFDRPCFPDARCIYAHQKHVSVHWHGDNSSAESQEMVPILRGLIQSSEHQRSASFKCHLIQLASWHPQTQSSSFTCNLYSLSCIPQHAKQPLFSVHTSCISLRRKYVLFAIKSGFVVSFCHFLSLRSCSVPSWLSVSVLFWINIGVFSWILGCPCMSTVS